MHAGPALADGQPSWTLHDPVRNKFFRIDWLGFEMLCRWRLGHPDKVAAALTAETTLTTEAEDVEAFALFLQENELLCIEPGHAKAMAGRIQRLRGSWMKWVLHHYLFFRVPLLKPDAWLTRWSGVVAPLYSRTFAWITLLALALGLLLVGREWGRFSATLQENFSWQGVVGYGLALAVIKVLHEFGHAFTAKRLGCRVPAMGLAFLVMLPVAYTDTNEVWKLTKRHQRLAVAGAGVLTELTIAVWATLAWALLPEGLPKGIAFMLATTTWIATLAINSSPFMRFDGYFLLSDWLDMPNLHSRSFALARWHLREALFGMGLPPPEYFSGRKTAALILFAYATWIYRLALFLGIAVLVYHFFIKLLGIFLFLVEIGWFVLMPLYQEIRHWPAMLQLNPGDSPGRPFTVFLRHARARRNAMLALAGLSLLLLPWPSRPTASGLLKPTQTFGIYAPSGAQLVHLAGKDGTAVHAGQTILELASPDIQLRWRRAQARVQEVRWLSANTGVDEGQRQNIQVMLQRQQTAEAELASVAADLVLYAPRAPFDGVLRNITPDLHPGEWVAAHERLATLVQPHAWQVETYLDEDAVRRIRIGDHGHFYGDGASGPNVALRVQSIEQDATHQLQSGMLAAQAGGSVLTRESHDKFIPERAVYRVVLSAENPSEDADHQSWRGQVVVRGDWEAPALAFVRSALVILWRELSF